MLFNYRSPIYLPTDPAEEPYGIQNIRFVIDAEYFDFLFHYSFLIKGICLPFPLILFLF